MVTFAGLRRHYSSHLDECLAGVQCWCHDSITGMPSSQQQYHYKKCHDPTPWCVKLSRCVYTPFSLPAFPDPSGTPRERLEQKRLQGSMGDRKRGNSKVIGRGTLIILEPQVLWEVLIPSPTPRDQLRSPVASLWPSHGLPISSVLKVQQSHGCGY